MQTLDHLDRALDKAVELLGNCRYGGILLQEDCRIALPLLSKRFEESVSCVYIDPPYRNGDVYEGYKDNATHEEWMALMSAIIPALMSLLDENGSLWISIDDAEMADLKVLCDTLLGRDRFVANIVWEHRLSRENRSIFSHNHEYLLVYAKDPSRFKAKRHRIRCDSLKKQYKNPDNDPRGPWQSITATAQAGHAVPSQFYEIAAPDTGKIHVPPKGRCWVYSKKRMMKEIEEGNIWFGADGCGVPRIKKFLSESDLEVVPSTLWRAEEVGTTQVAKREILNMASDDGLLFDTPKPEALLRRVLEIATDEGDVVLDAFLGSGTTAAVAYKMGRRFVGIEEEPRTMAFAENRISLSVPDALDFELDMTTSMSHEISFFSRGDVVEESVEMRSIDNFL